MNEPEYVENYGDSFSAVQIISYIAKKSMFINFIKNRNFYIFHIFRIFLKKRGGPWDSEGPRARRNVRAWAKAKLGKSCGKSCGALTI